MVFGFCLFALAWFGIGKVRHLNRAQLLTTRIEKGTYFLHIADFYRRALEVHNVFKKAGVRFSNWTFSANGHMVQNRPCWRAGCALGHPRQNDSIPR